MKHPRLPARSLQGSFDCGMPSLREDIPSLRMTTETRKVAIYPKCLAPQVRAVLWR